MLRALRFDDIDSRIQRKAIENLVSIRIQFEKYDARLIIWLDNTKLLMRCWSYFGAIVNFLPIKRRKPANYGTKIYALVEARTFYTSNLEYNPMGLIS